MNANKADEALQAKLRKLVEAESLFAVSKRMKIGREVLARYLANVHLNVSTFRGIEATLADGTLLGEASPDGLPR